MIGGTEQHTNAKIKVIGIGGGGSNAVSRMYSERIEDVDYMVINTDAQALLNCEIPMSMCIGTDLTAGMGVGGDPELGARAAEESRDTLEQSVRDTDMIFIAAGLGGGTGTGAAPIIANIARESSALTVGVVTTPFSFEGHKRMLTAQNGIKELRNQVDTLLIIPNERLSLICQEDITADNAFRMADDVLRLGVQSIAELVTVHGQINLDFNDVRTIMKNSGPAWMSIGYGTGENRAAEAAEQAITNPLLEVTIDGAKGVLFNITGGSDLKLSELNSAAEVIQRVVDPKANIIFGMSTDPKFENEIKLTVIATGFPTVEDEEEKEEELRQLLNLSSNNSSTELDVPPFLRRLTKYRKNGVA